MVEVFAFRFLIFAWLAHHGVLCVVVGRDWATRGTQDSKSFGSAEVSLDAFVFIGNFSHHFGSCLTDA
jgi:hypothetical protein